MSLKEVDDEIVAIMKDETNVMTSVTKAWEQRLTKNALRCQEEVEMELLKE